MTPTVDTPPPNPSFPPYTLAGPVVLKVDNWKIVAAIISLASFVFFVAITLDNRTNLKIATAISTLQSQIAESSNARAEMLLQEVKDRKEADSAMEERYIRALENLNKQLDRLNDIIDTLRQRLIDANADSDIPPPRSR